ncbi:hypothetical protein VCR14J2_30144 [Vibrio coralliirubri]|nr:hypothetical protein VCR14J2_30144 [Vibrio coralliirubri]
MLLEILDTSPLGSGMTRYLGVSRSHGDEWKVIEEVFTSFPIATKERNRESLLAIGGSRYFVPQFWNDGL